MRISICGGGPGGLYFAILMMRSNPRHEITIFERNPPGATYGWGVVFSDESLADLRDADYETYLAIDDALVRWNAIDIHYGGECIRSVGHGFAAIARTDLLRILTQRAIDLGVDVRFEHPIDDEQGVAELGAGCDLLVGADGVRSIVRATHQAHFGTTSSPHRSRYVWFGTDIALPVFTFIFRPTPHGLFQVHSYPFDATSSTFIVECTEATWRRAGLDTQTETEGLAFCQELFAEHLEDHKLLSNRSTWTTFVTLRNRSWHHGHTVLLGDAAHTAHFSIGSGTRLALDDAIALAKAFVAHPNDVAAAFAEYEGERQPVVERFQEVATDSARYFESVRRYLRFAPEQFAFNLLTRSGRIGHLELERRDPALVNRIDRWFAEQPEDRVVVPPPLLTPLHLTDACTLTNRVVLVPGDGNLERAAASGAGLVITEPVAPSPDGRATSESPGLWSDDQTADWAEVVTRVHEREAKIGIRLTHAGRRGATAPRQRGLDRPLPAAATWPLVAASSLPYTALGQTPHEASRATMQDLIEAFAAAARRAVVAGFDVMVVDMADGYLLAGFLSPLANRRRDDYGGDLEARARFPLEVLDAVRAAWGPDRALAVRLVADDRLRGGLHPADGVRLARLVAAHGCHLIDVAAGHTVATERSAPDYRRGFNVGLADRLRNEAGIPVMVSGHITRLDEVNTIVTAGRSDLCVLDPRIYGR